MLNNNNLNGAKTMRTTKEITSDIRAINTRANALNDLQNEGGEGYQHEPDTSALEAEWDIANAAERKEEWTKEVTIARRAEFNISGATKLTLTKIESKLGYTLHNLKKAIASHGIA